MLVHLAQNTEKFVPIFSMPPFEEIQEPQVSPFDLKQEQIL